MPKLSQSTKKVPDSDSSDYMPISLLSIYNKILEKLLYKRLYEFLDKVDAFYSLQFGFREKHSTNHALISMTETIQSTLDNGKYGCGVFDSRIIRRMMGESMLSTNAEIAPITVAVVNQTALRALCFPFKQTGTSGLAHNMQARPWSLVSILALP